MKDQIFKSRQCSDVNPQYKNISQRRFVIMGKTKNTIFTCLSITMASALAAALCAVGTTASAATAQETLSPGENVLVEASVAAPAEIALQNTTTYNYLLAVEPWTPDVSEALPFEVSVDGGAATELVPNSYMFGAYTAELALTEDSKNLTITTTSEETIELSVTLYAPVETTALPEDADNPAVLERWVDYTFNYKHTGDDGYYAMHWVTNTTGAEFNIMVKDRAEYEMGTTVQEETYPLYFVKNKTYYFTVTFTGVENSQINEADIYFSFDTWTAANIEINQSVYAPITPETEGVEYKVIPFGDTIVKPDTYLLRLNTEPVYPEGTVITAHIVNAAGAVIDTATSDTNSLFEVTLTEAATGVYFTSTYSERFVGAVVADITPSQTVEFIVGEEAEVTLKANEALVCLLMNVPATGTYNIVLTDLPTPSPVRVYDAYDTIVPAGETSGTFAVVMEYPNEYGYPGETTKDAAITFQNNSAEKITFYATITKNTDNFDVELGKATTLSAPAHSSVVYYVPGITGEDYLAEFAKSGDAADGNAIVYDYFNRYEPLVFANKPQAIYSFGNITLEEGRTLTYAFVVVNNSDTDNEFTFTFTKVNTILVGEDAVNNITVNGTTSADYYIGGITTGRYLIRLNVLTYNADFTVTYNDQVVVSSGKLNGYLVVNSFPGQVEAIARLTVTNNGAQPVEFNATVTQAVDGTMVLGRAQTVTLGNDDTSETYNIALAAEVSYTAKIEGTIPEDVTVYAIVNGTYVEFVEGTANILLDMDASSIEFTYFYDGTINFTFTVTITESAT